MDSAESTSCLLPAAPTGAYRAGRSISGCEYNHVLEQGLPWRVEESRLCDELCDYRFDFRSIRKKVFGKPGPEFAAVKYKSETYS